MSSNEMMAGEGTLVRASNMVTEARVDFDRLAASLTDQLLSAQGKWQGVGGTAFFGLQQAWTDKQKIIVSALETFSTELTGTDTVMTSADDTAATAANANLHRLHDVR